HLAKSLALEYGRYGIRINVVSPGVVRTPATAGALEPEQDAAMAEKVPLGRIGVPEDIAKAVLFFASPLADYVSGQVLAVDGGVTARFPLPLPGGHPSEAVYAPRPAHPARALQCTGFVAPSSRGLGHHPLKVATRVRIPLGL